MIAKLKSVLYGVVKAGFEAIGLDVQFKSSSLTERAVLAQIFKAHPIDLLIDVGANSGQYGALARACGYTGTMLSLEPLALAHAALITRAGGDPKWFVCDRMAVGAQDTEIFINVAANSVSSSILPMLETHARAAPSSQYISRESVPLRRLDAVVGAYINKVEHALLKIDTQGFEADVLMGAAETLPHCRLVQVELSLISLYAGQPLFLDICSQLSALGFDLRYLIPGFRNPCTSELLQVDGIFLRRTPA